MGSVTMKLYYQNENCTGAGKVEWFDEDPGDDYTEIGDEKDAIELADCWRRIQGCGSYEAFRHRVAKNIYKEIAIKKKEEEVLTNDEIGDLAMTIIHEWREESMLSWAFRFARIIESAVIAKMEEN
jgi:hypothetical protein